MASKMHVGEPVEVTHFHRWMFAIGANSIVVLAFIVAIWFTVWDVRTGTGTGTMFIPMPYGTQSYVRIETTEPYEVYTLGFSRSEVVEKTGTNAKLNGFGIGASGSYESQRMTFEVPTKWHPYTGNTETFVIVPKGEREITVTIRDDTPAFYMLFPVGTLMFAIILHSISVEASIIFWFLNRNRRYIELVK